jgi:hypothetical protein
MTDVLKKFDPTFELDLLFYDEKFAIYEVIDNASRESHFKVFEEAFWLGREQALNYQGKRQDVYHERFLRIQAEMEVNFG